MRYFSTPRADLEKKITDFVAVGKYQAEFFDRKTKSYFQISSPANIFSADITLDLSKVLVSRESDSNYYLVEGKKRIDMLFTETEDGTRLSFYKYYFGRIRKKAFSGIVSSTGAELIKKRFSECRPGLAA